MFYMQQNHLFLYNSIFLSFDHGFVLFYHWNVSCFKFLNYSMYKSSSMLSHKFFCRVLPINYNHLHVNHVSAPHMSLIHHIVAYSRLLLFHMIPMSGLPFLRNVCKPGCVSFSYKSCI